MRSRGESSVDSLQEGFRGGKLALLSVPRDQRVVATCRLKALCRSRQELEVTHQDGTFIHSGNSCASLSSHYLIWVRLIGFLGGPQAVQEDRQLSGDGDDGAFLG